MSYADDTYIQGWDEGVDAEKGRILDIIDSIKIDLDMPRSQETWNWIKKELKDRISEKAELGEEQ